MPSSRGSSQSRDRTQGSNLGRLHCRWILYRLSHQGSPRILEWVTYPFSRVSPDPGIELESPVLQVDSLPAELPGKPNKPRQHINNQRHYFANKGPSSQSYGFSSSYVWMWELDCKESWAPKNWCFWTVVLDKTFESPLDCKEIKLVNSKGNQSWIFHWKDWCWSWNSNTLATWWGELTHLKWLWCWKKLMLGEGDDRGWDGWISSLFQWTRVWLSSGSGQGSLMCCSS